MKIGESISFIDLIKHTLSDSFEFSAHTIGNSFQEQYILNGVGMDFSVEFNEDGVLHKLKEQKVTNTIFLHTHPLANDSSLKFTKGKPDPRKLIAFGMKTLPLGNPPTKGDIEYFHKFKSKCTKAGVLVKGAVLSARGIWLFDTKQELKLKDEKATTVGSWSSSVSYLILKSDYPSYFMELEAPKNVTKVNYQHKLPTKSNLQIWTKVKELVFRLFLNKKLKVITKSFYKQGVLVEFISYKSLGIDPVKLLKETIQDWEKTFL